MAKCYGSTGLDYFFSIALTPDGGYLAGGITLGNDGDVLGNHGSGDYWVVKINNVGTILWQKCYGGTAGEELEYIFPVSDGYILAGSVGSSDGDVTGFHPGIFSDAWLVKIDLTGTLIWQKCYGGSGSEIFLYAV